MLRGTPSKMLKHRHRVGHYFSPDGVNERTMVAVPLAAAGADLHRRALRLFGEMTAGREVGVAKQCMRY